MFMQMAGRAHWFLFDVKNHIVLLNEMGVDVAELQTRYEALREEIPREQREGNDAWMRLEQDVVDLDEATEPGGPSVLEEIRALRPSDRVDRYDETLGDDVLADKIHAGWLGRVIGCTLGKPVESFLAEEDSPPRLKEYLQRGGQWPLIGYTREASVVPYWTHLRDDKGMPKWFNNTGSWAALAERLQYAPADDDIQYTGIALRKMQERGRRFDARGTLAYLNWAFSGHNEKAAVRRNLAMGMDFPRATRFMNTTREWITPEIRADLYGLACPGAPEAAAGLAFHDGAATASENGIYGGMFMAAAIAAAFVEDEPRAIIRRGLEQIPAECRLAREIHNTLETVDRNGDDVDKTLAEVYQRLKHYFCIALVNNCCFIVAGLAHAGRDFTKAIGYSVMAGLDTDCNGANAGTIAGVMLGRAGIDAHWTEPLHDTVDLALPHCQRTTISALAEQTLQLLKDHPLP
jgi:ADP-ribosylglycohydrolase